MHLYHAGLFVLLLTAGIVNTAHSQCTILLHGLARSSDSMAKLEAALAPDYTVVNVDYPSRKHTVEVLSATVLPPALDKCGDHTVHFVTHSMGGLLIRQYLTQHAIERLGRIVMLGPPNQGSEVIDALGNWPGLEWLNGPAGQQLGTRDNSIPLALGDINSEIGIIAGDRTINFILSSIIPGSDDGKVSVERTKLSTMKDHIIIHTTHPFMMKNDAVIAQVKHFLLHGTFNHNQEKPTD
jgi:triacylglycerol lipase